MGIGSTLSKRVDKGGGGFRHGLAAVLWLGIEIKVGSLVPGPPPFLFFGLHSV